MGKSPFSILVILLLLISFNNGDENKAGEVDTEAAEEEGKQGCFRFHSTNVTLVKRLKTISK